MDLTEISKAAMQVILHAGNARDYEFQAFDAILADNQKAADELRMQAKEEILLAHKQQTDILQSEASGVEQPHSYLFGHAQDTLMTVQTQMETVDMMIKLYNKAINTK